MLVSESAWAPMHSTVDDAPKLTLRRLSHSEKHLAPTSTTLSGIDNDSMLVSQNAPAQRR